MSQSNPTLTVATDALVPQLARLVHFAFGSPLDMCEGWLKRSPVQNLRAVMDGDIAVASLLRIPMAQFWGGRSVPMVGIAGVAVAPERRGCGLARSMMQACVREMADEGFALSALYASTQALYRQCGYEQAGSFSELQVSISQLSGGKAGPAVRALSPEADHDAIRACYRRWAPMWDGSLDRGNYIWDRICNKRGTLFEPFGVYEDGLAAYVFINQSREASSGRHDVQISDMAWTTPSAGKALLSFLAGFATMGEHVVFSGAPSHPLVHLMQGVRVKPVKLEHWMVRVLRFNVALEARGYNPGLAAACELVVHDDLVPANAGTWRVEVEDGRARVAPGRGGDALHVGPRGLAAIYSGRLGVAQAVLNGLAEGSPNAVRAAEAIFPAGSPWCADFF